MNEPLDPLQTTYEKNRQIRTLVGEAKDRSAFDPVDMFKLTGAHCGLDVPAQSPGHTRVCVTEHI